jgi:NAD(P)-dependent dehydrogenase (short-subunit alcohol dehydrogenase family)
MNTTNPSSQTSIALVTGGSRGLGKSMALHLAARGVDVVIAYRSKEKEAKEVVAQIVAQGRKAVALALDVADSRSFGSFAERLKAELTAHWKRDRFDFLVNNAGTVLHASFMETTEAQFDDLVNVHLKSTFFLSQNLLPLMQDGGRIVNVSSGLARFTFPGARPSAVCAAMPLLSCSLSRTVPPLKSVSMAPGATSASPTTSAAPSPCCSRRRATGSRASASRCPAA